MLFQIPKLQNPFRNIHSQTNRRNIAITFELPLPKESKSNLLQLSFSRKGTHRPKITEFTSKRTAIPTVYFRYFPINLGMWRLGGWRTGKGPIESQGNIRTRVGLCIPRGYWGRRVIRTHKGQLFQRVNPNRALIELRSNCGGWLGPLSGN